MASDSPARSLDEIDLSALRVGAPPRCARAHAVYARVREASVRTCLPALTFLRGFLVFSSLLPFVSTRLYRAVLTDDCARVRGGARSRRPVIEEIGSDEERVWPPADAPDAAVDSCSGFVNVTR